MLSIDLRWKIALVTGATSQLGRTMARTLAQCGADVAVHFHKNQAMAEALVAQIRQMGRRAVWVQADVTSLEEVMAMKEVIAIELGHPDIIVNNAVLQYHWTSVLEQPVEDYEGQFRSSVLHNVNMAKAFVPAMMEKQYGRVIGINTECSMQLLPTQSAYVAGKRGMDGVLRVLAKEVGPYQITVNQVAPGWTISERERENGLDDSEQYLRTVPLQRRGDDQEIANAVAFLASDLASNISGVYLPVCGGNVMPCI